jgi:hypothetical protein
MIVQYSGGAPNSIIFIGVSLIITIVWYSKNGRALGGATGILEEAVEESGYYDCRLVTYLDVPN